MKQTKMIYKFKLKAIMLLIGVLFLPLYMELSANAAVKSGSCGESLTWTLSENILTIEGTGEMTDYADGALAPWFGLSGDISEINLPEGMTSIGDYAFFGCGNVTNISIPSSVAEIGECAFAQCRSLLCLQLQEGIEIVGEGAFQECEALPEISFPGTLKSIGSKAYFKCYGLTEVTVPENVTEIGESAFSYCTGLIRATVNAPLEELPGWTFYGCTALSDVSLAPSMVSVGQYAFLFCENLNGIYTQGGNVETVHALENSIYSKDGAPKEEVVKAYAMPESSIVETDDGKTYTQITVTNDENLTVITKKITEYEGEQDSSGTEIEAVVNAAEDWKLLSEIVKAQNLNEESVLLKTYFFSDIIESEALEYFVGSPVVLQIIAKTGGVWEIDMSEMTLSSFTGQYVLEEMTVSSVLQTEEAVPENESTSGMTTIPENESAKELPIFEPYDADSVDTEESDLETVDSNPETSNLKDAEGTTYYISKRSSKWGITLKQFSVYVALWIASAVLIVAVIMLTANQRKKSKEQYEELVKQGEAEDAATQEELQLQIMKEILNKKE